MRGNAWRRRCRWALAAVLGTMTCVAAALSGGETNPMAVENCIPNPSFEMSDGSFPAGWHPRGKPEESVFAWSENGRGGGRCVSAGSAAAADQVLETVALVRPFATYRLRGWIKTESIAGKEGGVSIGIAGLEQEVRTRSMTGTQDWTQVEAVFETKRVDGVTVQCLFGGTGKVTGRAWFDDLSIEQLAIEAIAPSVAIDTAKTGAPVSKYIYGQFIEHLGRCIYGGIWAEMLEDRKFFHAVGSEESPWEGSGTVAMAASGAYVGEHSPEFGGSIAQSKLALRKGHQYVGRIVLSGAADSGPVDVVLSWGLGANDQAVFSVPRVTPEYRTSSFSLACGGDTVDGKLSIVCRGPSAVRVGAVSLMPADNIDGMRADTLALLKELNAPVYRWPGGNFVSGYNWKDGIGDRDRRPPRKNPAWLGVEHNDFGLDEFMFFCGEIGAEPLIVVNSGLGDVALAAEELEYANGAPDSAMGSLRARNGHAAAYGVTWWGVGNEMYGGWQLGHMPLEAYVDKHNAFADALRAQDPGIKLVAVGDTGRWSETMLTRCAEQMDLLSEHFYFGEKQGVLNHVDQLAGGVRFKVKNHRKYLETIPALADKKVPLAIDEWNYWYGPHVYGELGTRYFLKDGLGVAAALHEMIRSSDVVFMANYAQTVNVIGAIKTTPTAAAFDTTGVVLKLYRNHFGVTPVTVSGEQGVLDVSAALSEDKSRLTIGIVNPAAESGALAVTIDGVALSGSARLWVISGEDPMAYNEPGEPLRVEAVTSSIEVKGPLQVAPFSVSVVEVRVP